MARARFQSVVQEEDGDIRVGTSVTLYEEDGTTPLAAAIYAAESGGSALPSNVLTTDALGRVIAYTAAPQRAQASVGGVLTPIEFLVDPDDLVTVAGTQVLSNKSFSDATSFAGAITATSTMTVAGDFAVDITTLAVDAGNNRVGVGTTTYDATDTAEGTKLKAAVFRVDKIVWPDGNQTGVPGVTAAAMSDVSNITLTADNDNSGAGSILLRSGALAGAVQTRLVIPTLATAGGVLDFVQAATPAAPAQIDAIDATRLYAQADDHLWIRSTGGSAFQVYDAGGPAKGPDGTTAAPTWSYSSDTNTGRRWISSGLEAYVSDGTDAIYFGNKLLGIGVSPTARLEIKGGTGAVGDGLRLVQFNSGTYNEVYTRSDGAFVVNNNGTDALRVVSNSMAIGVAGGPNSLLELRQSADTAGGGLRLTNVATNRWDVFHGGDGRFYIQYNSTGNIISFTNAGLAEKSAGGSGWDVFSDRRLKREIRTYEGGLDLIRRLPPPVRFEYNGDGRTVEGQRGISFVAQDVQRLYPEMVHASDEYLTLDTTYLIPTLVNAVKELAAQVERLTRGQAA